MLLRELIMVHLQGRQLVSPRSLGQGLGLQLRTRAMEMTMVMTMAMVMVMIPLKVHLLVPFQVPPKEILQCPLLVIFLLLLGVGLPHFLGQNQCS